MKDVELLILKSFAYAVMRQSELPETIRQRIQHIAQSFGSRVADLDALARSSPLLSPHYRWAYSYLTSSAAERGMGVSVVPASYDEEGPSSEPINIVSAPERYDFDGDRETLNAIDNRVNEANSQAMQQALSSDNSLQALTDLLTPSL